MTDALNEKVIVVQGPTASGKSSLAEALAQRLSGEIISADSMQVYRGMDIGTAKVPESERSVPYHCIDIRKPGEEYSAALFQQDARAAIEQIKARGNVAIICGGTGLYVQAAVDDMDFAAGELESPARKKYEEMLDGMGALRLHEHLASLDPESAALIHPNNSRRVVRALEMLEVGESYAQRKNAFSSVPPLLPSVRLALAVDRDILYERINARVDAMVEEGLIEEVRCLLERGFRDALTAAQAIGYKEIVSYLDGNCTLEEALEQVKQSSRRYAKRQMTWLRRDEANVWLDASDGITDTLVSQSIEIIERDRTA